MSEDLLQQQIAYYDARAEEYDEWFYRIGRYNRGEVLNRQWFDETATLFNAVHNLPDVNTVLEIACGTGIWTRELVILADQVTAVDASPEMLRINQEKVQAHNITYVEQDVFTWEPEQSYDLVFFAFWLSHVPQALVADFMTKAYLALKPGGRVFIIDSRRAESSTALDQTLPEEDGDLSTRRLNDGREYNIVKIFYEPASLKSLLQNAGFMAEVKTTPNYFIYATGIKRGAAL